ncbi:hypothetical protein B0H13DRAFT_1859686 [Mycena leptocephala]|nr:hypothetical protein B0H13DRAFT_1859686 [Mycena leptocephala]
MDVGNILSYYFGDKALLSRQSCMVGERVSPVFMLSNYLIPTAVFSSLSAVLTARLILNMREVADTKSMAVGDVASVEASTVEWNDIDGIPMEDTRGHVRNRASWGYAADHLNSSWPTVKESRDSRYPGTSHQDFDSFSWDILEIVYFNTKVHLDYSGAPAKSQWNDETVITLEVTKLGRDSVLKEQIKQR